jgi:hypothetical protein
MVLAMGAGPSSASVTEYQGLTRAHFSAQLEDLENIAHVKAKLEHLRDTSTV